MHPIVLTLALLALTNWSTATISPCTYLNTEAACTANVSPSCAWCSAAYTCIPTPANDALCTNECTLCYANSNVTQCAAKYPTVTSPPPAEDIICANGGVRAWTSNYPRQGGQQCNCLPQWAGADCSVCISNSSCATGETCNTGLVPTLKVPKRSASCYCDTNFCTGTMELSPSVGQITFTTWLSNSSSTLMAGSVNLYKEVPLPADIDSTVRQSPLFVGIDVDQCVVSLNAPCNQACKVGGCSGAPWGDSSTCDIWVCLQASVNCAPSEFDYWSAACGNQLLVAALQPPFSIACVTQSTPGVSTCSVSSAAFAFGAIVMTCAVGRCANFSDPVVNTSYEATCDSTCLGLRYAFLIIAPLLFTILVLAGCVALDKGSFRIWQQPPPLAEDDMLEDEFAGPPLDDKRPPAPTLVVRNVVLTIPAKSGWAAGRVDADSAKAQLELAHTGFVGGDSAQNGPKVVLRGVSLFMGGKDMLAICGPSGSGKTSLLDMAAGRKSVGQIQGEFVLDGLPVWRQWQLRNAVGYVLQDDALPGTSTVREVLLFHAALRMPWGLKAADKHARVDRVLRALNLTQAQNTLIGDGIARGVSGGERRRCSVGVEMVAGKRLLLMDEPVSGLDSQSAEQVVQSLRRLSQQGQGVVVSIHQPSSRIFHLVPLIAVLSRFGQLTYFGPSARLGEFLAQVSKPVPAAYNPVEWMLDLVALRPAGDVDSLVAAYLASPVCAEMTALAQQMAANKSQAHQTLMTPPPSFYKQLVVLSSRFARNAYRHRVLPLVHVVAMILVSIIASILYWQASDDLGGAINRMGFFFFMQIYLTFSALTDLGAWQEERMVFIRERASGAYGAAAFLLSKVLCQVIALRFFPIVVSCFILINCIGLVNTPLTLANMMGAFLFISMDSVLLFLAIGFCIPRPGVANFVAVVVAILSLALSGFLLIDFGLVGSPTFQSGGSSGASSVPGLTSAPTSSGGSSTSITPLRWVPYIFGFLDYLRPAYEIMVTNELTSLVFSISLKNAGGISTTGASIPLAGSVILDQLGLNASRMQLDFGLMAMWFFIFLFVAWLSLDLLVMERR